MKGLSQTDKPETVDEKQEHFYNYFVHFQWLALNYSQNPHYVITGLRLMIPKPTSLWHVKGVGGNGLWNTIIVAHTLSGLRALCVQRLA